MTLRLSAAAAAAAAAALLASAPAAAQQSRWAAQIRQSDVTFPSFRFRDGESLPGLRIHYATLGTPRTDAAGNVVNAVMILHGTGGTGLQFLAPQFADELYGPGQPLDLARYFIILPDGIGHGKSSKPSDGLRMHFPKYDYDDMVEAQRQLLERLRVKRLRLLLGTSMGCMHGFVWGTTHPQMVQAMMPLACLPVELAGQNRMWRRAAIEGIESDPAWAGGNYTAEPVQGLRTAVTALTMVGFAPYYLQKTYPTRQAADAYVVKRIADDIATRDANDLVYQLDASRNYNPWPLLDRMTVPTTWINSSDDLINPPGYGIGVAAARRLRNGSFILIPASSETRGHGTHTWAKFWKQHLVALLARTEGR